ncbi:MAG: branched-chain amino acid ABC transporter permease [Pseudomonadota bacterium]
MKALLWIPLLALPVVVHSNFILTIFIFSFILGMMAVSFNLIFGFTGQLSMFHAAAFGLAAYITYLSMTLWHVSFWIGLLPAIVFTILISLIVGSICFKFKLKAFYFAVVTLAFSELARLIVMNWNSVTNGTLGLLVLEKPFIWLPGLGLIKIDGTTSWYFLSLAGLMLTVGVCALILRSWIGRCFAAIRLNEDLAQTLGIDIFRYKLLSFVIANVLAAFAGSLYAFYIGYIEPAYLGINQSLDIIAMVLLGGRFSLAGPIVGAFVLTGLPHVIDLSGEARAMLYGVILILTILIMPQGIVGALAGWRRAA